MVPTALVILDGFGYNAAHTYNAIYAAHPPFFNWLLTQYPWTLLQASGTAVGLLDHMIGNSEVGHMTIGSGRIIKQPLVLLYDMIDDQELFSNAMLIHNLTRLMQKNRTLHIMGLLSDAGVHSHEYHLWGLLRLAKRQGVQHVVVHPFLDGRDVPPRSAAIYLKRLAVIMEKLDIGRLGSLHGRFYAMDRDNHWERTKLSYDVLTQPHKPRFVDWQTALAASYAHNISDEFFVPQALSEDAHIRQGDGLIFFNFRPDRARQLTRMCIDPAFDEVPRTFIPLSYMVTGTPYSPDLPTESLCQRAPVNNTLLDVLEAHNKRIFTIAETEKYAHITYFFSGGHEAMRANETRTLIPSLRLNATYASTPRMSADAITGAVLTSLTNDPRDFYLINYANADMVGHSGDFNATVQAVRCLDEQLKALYNTLVKQLGGTLYITGDHGKAESMWDELAQQPRTAHTNNPVYFIAASSAAQLALPKLSQLSDIAPFILDRMGLPVPTVMSRIK